MLENLEKRIEILESEKKEIVRTLKTMADYINTQDILINELAESFCLLVDTKYPNNSAQIFEKIEKNKNRNKIKNSNFEIIKRKD